jgi:hypothetical protein
MTSVPTVSWDQALTWRLRRQMLAPRAGTDPQAVVSRLVGVQAQVPSAANLAVATRMTPTGVRALGTGPEAVATVPSLLRTWAMRGTLHLLTVPQAADVMALLSAIRSWERSSWQRTFAPSDVIAHLSDLVGEALSGDPLTREELIDAVSDRLSATVLDQLRSGWGTLLKPLAWQGVLCQGPRAGTRATFTRPDLLFSQWRGLPDPDEAGPRTVLAYLGAHGPATAEAFDQWLLRGSTPRSRLRAWFRDAGDRTAEVDVEGRIARIPAEDLDDLLATRPASSVRLLPGFDQYLLGPGTKDTAILPAEHRGTVSRAGGWISPVVIHRGRVVGVWELRDDLVTVSPFPDAPPLPTRSVDGERAVLSAALGREVDLRTQPRGESRGG